MIRILVLLGLMMLGCSTAHAQGSSDLQTILQGNAAEIAKPSRRTAGAVVEALLASGHPKAREFLRQWRDRNVWQRDSDGLFFLTRQGDPLVLIELETGEEAGTADKRALSQIRPNSGVQGVVDAALVRFQLSDPDPAVRRGALDTIQRAPQESHLEALRGAIDDDPDPGIKARKNRIERLLTIQFGADEQSRVEAITAFEGDTDIAVRSALNPILATVRRVAAEIPADENIAAKLSVPSDIPFDEAYAMLADAGLAQKTVSTAARNQALVANIENGEVAEIPVPQLDNEAARDRAYGLLAQAGTVPPYVTAAERERLVDEYAFYDAYRESSLAVTDAARETLQSINRTVGLYRLADLSLDALSLASIYFLAAIGLAITFGVMGVINMAHGEFIMMGAFTGYVVQQWIPDYTTSLLVALPLAFVITFLAGVALERLVIRHLISRPLETLLATFGVSIALQQIAKNVFGTQARPLTAPGWLDGSLVINDIIQISYIRIAIFVLACVFLVLLLLLMNRTRLGLEVRAVTQNRRMAASMGINPDRINMLTFGIGSGIAGVAGVAIGLYAQVTSELGTNYIVQSFMTVVVGGVGNLWGMLAGAGMIGSLQKLIEFFNPSNTLAAQTYMIIFIIIFIQFRPRGLIALKGRAAGD